MSNNNLCPVCGKHEFKLKGFYQWCPICDWQDDEYQEMHPDEAGGANNISLNEARRLWQAKQK